MKLNKNNKFWAEFEVLPNGKLKVKIAKKYTNVNQNLKYWKQINARDFARTVAKSQLLTK